MSGELENVVQEGATQDEEEKPIMEKINDITSIVLFAFGFPMPVC